MMTGRVSRIFLLNLTLITNWQARWERHGTGFGKITRFKEPGYQELVSIINERSLAIFNKTSLSFVGIKEEEYFGWTSCVRNYIYNSIEGYAQGEYYKYVDIYHVKKR
ncbi:MAG: hypothetical protein GF308_21840 [Candidatus Heimdallarchaeota archaeon]|nr:hypothetical protein [Candidatus Heimdallarchaeota archaeon]